ncbi:MAG: NAD(P)(+) transhydrogenase (Re/Si-specific) subunit beta [Planctomycetia bacterium]|nr:MAG: NAD(P)(+) transhydrogenase (Re/Si-specific) subunit beta [Planctomycetia bacterium]
MSTFVDLAYIPAAGLFILSLSWMSDPKTARNGVFAGVAAMGLAILATWARPDVTQHWWIILPILLAVGPGVWLSMVPLTAVPQRTALSHAFGGLAAGLVGTAKYFHWYLYEPEMLTPFRMSAIILEIILGYLTLTGSLIAAGKLQEVKWIPQRPWIYKGQNTVNIAAFGLALVCGVILIFAPNMAVISPILFILIIVLALNFGWMLVMPIGGADMPTVISILNSYAGLSAVAMGLVLDNNLLITAGALDGSSGLILSIIMCRAMNRSFTNVLFGAFGQVQAQAAVGEKKTAKSATHDDAAQLLEYAQSVIIVPGYGMAVAHAQHAVAELATLLRNRGISVRFAIHPVAGRMPGHMNVLLTEANVPYDLLYDLDINPEFEHCDVGLVIGANDVVNPAARHDKTSPIYGMPIFDVDKCKTVLVCKRSMNTGFAGIENELFFLENTLMLFGDAKQFITEINSRLKGGGSGH